MILSERQREVLTKLCIEDVTSLELAEKMNVSIHTINSHRSRIVKKLDSRSIHYAVINYLETEEGLQWYSQLLLRRGHYKESVKSTPSIMRVKDLTLKILDAFKDFERSV